MKHDLESRLRTAFKELYEGHRSATYADVELLEEAANALSTTPTPEASTGEVAFIEFAPSYKTVNPKPANQRAACGTFWYAQGWIDGKCFEFATQDSRADAELLCIRLNTAVLAALSPKESDL